jgi:exopolysaccharide biosynthesis polyprenyl glycosylphosphotransferase
MVVQVPIDFLFLFLAGISAFYLRFTPWAVALKPVLFKMTLPQFLWLVCIVAVGWLVIFAFIGLYSTNPNRKLAPDLTRVILACSAGLGAVALYILFTQTQFDSRFLVVAGWAFAIVYVCAGRILMRGFKGILYRAGIGLRRVAIIGSGSVTKEIVQTLKTRKALGYKVVVELPWFWQDKAEELKKLDLDEILFTNPRANEEETFAIMDFANENHIVFKYSADLFAAYSANMSVSPLAGVPIVELRKTSLDGWGRVTKRIFDIIISILVIIITSPLMLLSALIILFETGLPIIYKNERVGIRGKNFFTLKFRSMYKKDCTGSQFGDAGKVAEEKEKELIAEQSIKEGPVYKIANDPRVTGFGRLIRRWSVDEVPQFFNVLAGSMSIVGPRPHQPREVAQYEKKYRKLLTLKPGVTGLAQISGRSNLTFEEEARLDILYIEKWNLFLDLIIFIKTPFVVLRRKGAM